MGMAMEFERMQLLEERLHILQEAEEGSVWVGMNGFEPVTNCHRLRISWRMYRLLRIEKIYLSSGPMSGSTEKRSSVLGSLGYSRSIHE